MTALFRSAHEALLFAYTYADARGHPIAAAAERQIALSARDRYEREPGASRGLTGLDGAAQAGMIQAEVERLHPLHQAAIVARFSVLDVAQRQAACSLLALRARHTVRCPFEALILLLRRQHGLRVNVGRVADQHDVCERTVRGWSLAVRKWLNATQKRAMDAAEKRLSEAGIVESA